MCQLLIQFHVPADTLWITKNIGCFFIWDNLGSVLNAEPDLDPVLDSAVYSVFNSVLGLVGPLLPLGLAGPSLDLPGPPSCLSSWTSPSFESVSGSSHISWFIISTAKSGFISTLTRGLPFWRISDESRLGCYHKLGLPINICTGRCQKVLPL